jgi:hypothetical protein
MATTRFEDRGHFMNSRLPELAEVVETRIRALLQQDSEGAS